MPWIGVFIMAAAFTILPATRVEPSPCLHAKRYVDTLTLKIQETPWVDAPEAEIIDGWEREIYLLTTHLPECEPYFK